MRIALFGDGVGIPQLLRFLRPKDVAAIVGSAIRPAHHLALAESAKGLNVPLLIQPVPSSPAYHAFLACVTKVAPELILVNSYAMLLPPDILGLPHMGAVNLHGGLLPEQRGPNPIEWTILSGGRVAGATLHWMDGDFDTGDIIARHEVPIRLADTWLDVRRRVVATGERLLEQNLPLVLAGKAPRLPQDSDKGHRFRRRRAEDGRFTWAHATIDIYNLVRAVVSPHPGASVQEHGRTIDFVRWISLPEVVWRKSIAIGGFAIGGGRLQAERPPADCVKERANRHIRLGFCSRFGRDPRVTVEIIGIDDWRAARYRLLPANRAARVLPPHRLGREIAAFVEREFKCPAVHDEG